MFGFNATLLDQPHAYASSSPERMSNYDYIVVGGGTAGCVIASRLTEDPSVRVLLLEAGGSSQILESRIPLGFSKLFKGPKDWDYETVSQPNVDGRELYWPRAKMLGGCSAINAIIYHHSSPSDYDEWERLGCKNWSYRDLHPYFLKAERFSPNHQRPKVDNAHRGAQGPWQTGHAYMTDIATKAFIPSCEANGIPFVPDINTPNGTHGVTNFMTFIDQNGIRSSTASAYLTPDVQKRPNLTIAINAIVRRVLFDHTPRAIGVEIQTTRDGPLFYASASYRVVLSAGAINTPQTLLLSGIGPKSHLQQFGINTIVDNPHVGAHLKDHFCASTVLARAKPGITLDHLKNDLKAIPSMLRWLTVGGGPLSGNGAEAGAFFCSTDPTIPALTHPLTKPENKPEMHGSMGVGPDIEIICLPMGFIDHGFGAPPKGHNMITLLPIGLRPQSEGRITLRTSDAWDKPDIDPRYWSDENDNDRKVMLAAIRLCIALFQHEAFKNVLEPFKITGNENSVYWPMNADPATITDDQILKWMAKRSGTLYHPVSSARMAPTAEQGVVDLNLSVHGVEGLSVCDASIFPEQISGHPTAPIVAVAEKFADILKAEHASKPRPATTTRAQQHQHQIRARL